MPATVVDLPTQSLVNDYRNLRGKRITTSFAMAGVPTASITTIEYESGAIADLKRAMERLAPRDEHYEHNLRWGDGNGYSHIRAAMLGPSVTVPVEGGQLALGTWQQIVLCDFDNRPRRRRVLLRLLG